MTDHAEDIIPLYARSVPQWDNDRGRDVAEKAWLDRFIDLLPRNRDILDLGCGTGEPIARYFVEKGCAVTGVDAAAGMIDVCRNRFPADAWIVSDMRGVALHRKFSGIIAWNSFFHLTPGDQRQMFSVFRDHAEEGAALMFTSGTSHGVTIGEYRGCPLYHASLDPSEYRELLHKHEFEVISHIVEDPDCGNHTVWLAQYRG